MIPSRRAVAAFLAVVGCLSASSAGRVQAAPGIVAIKNVSVFDVTGARMLPGRTVVIEGELIKAVGAAADVPVGATVLDGSGKFLIPGFIDAHVHLVHLADRTHVPGDEFLPMFLAAGVTSVRSTGDAVAGEQRIARFAEEHPETCSRVFMCSPLVDGDPPFHKDVGKGLTKAEEVAPFVEEMKRAGVTTLKMYVGCTREIGRRVIEEGHRQGLVTTGHLGLYAAQDAVADGIDCLEHVWSVLDYSLARGETRVTCDLKNPRAVQLVSAIKEHHVAVDPTLVVHRNMLLLADQPEFNQHPDNAKAPERMREYWQRALQERAFTPETLAERRKELRKYQDVVAELYRAGITLLAGTDSPEPFVCPGFSLHQELELLVESGLPPAAALKCATLNNARIVRAESRLGSVEPGKVADLVLLERNPLEDIRSTRSVAKVIRGGRVLEPGEILGAVPRK